MFESIRNRLALLFVLLVTIPLVVIGVMSDLLIEKYTTINGAASLTGSVQDKDAKISSFLRGVVAEIDVLAGDTMKGLVTAIETGSGKGVTIWRMNLENEFVNFMRAKRVYDRISYRGNDGREIVRVDFNGKEAVVVPEDNFQNDADATYFKETMKLNKGEVYVSPLEPNREHGKVRASFKPVIHYAQPVFNGSGDRAGVIMIDVSGEGFLKEIKGSNERIILVNKDGYFLSHPNEDIEWGFYIEDRKEERLQKYYPKYSSTILNGRSGYVDTGSGWPSTWSYWFYSPNDELVAYQPIFPNPTDKKDYWVIIKSENKKELMGTLIKMRVVMVGLTVAIYAIAIPIIFFFGLKITNPISKLQKAMDMFDREEDREKATEIVKDNLALKNELGLLSSSFVTMSERLHNTQERLDIELQRLRHLVQFGSLVGDEVSEKECYAILIKFLTGHFHLDRILAVSFNNSENLTEIIASYENKEGILPFCAPSPYDLKVIQDARLCRAVRSGKSFVVNDVEGDYRCPYQEVVQDKGSYACLPVTTGGAILGWVHLVNMEKGYFSPERQFTIESYINTIAPAVNSMRLLNAHRKLSIRDPLTGLYNRRFLEETMERQMALAERYKQSMSLIMLDIDHFKKFNDTHGHSFGDRVLKLVADIIVKTVRNSDTVARYGGEEFVVLLPNTDIEGAFQVAEKLRIAVEHCTIATDGTAAEGVTISLGVSCYPTVAVTIKELIDSADDALYRSKSMGRNRTTKYEKSAKILSDAEKKKGV
ncbi:MAG: diguanylate cyclase [Deltaproteobacteria bacterium]|nr:diguanylate cyclase [Deltaproteobacteria bacterium]